MHQPDLPAQPCLFTVGHSNHPTETFLHLLRQHGIEVVVDVRSAPYSRYVPHYNRETLQAALQSAGFKYLFLGKELGGRPDGAEFYDAQGHVLYSRLAQAPLFLAGIERLEKGITRCRVALLCAEENPIGCHRHRLVSRVMTQRGHPVLHIRGDGRLQAEADVPSLDPQPTLFAELAQEQWKSLRPISPRGSEADVETDPMLGGKEGFPLPD